MADVVTYDAIATTTLGSNTGTITFTSIPSTYTDLILIAYAKGTDSASSMTMQFNSSGSGYSDTEMTGNGSTVGGGENTNNSSMYCTNMTNNWIYFRFDINSYANTSYRKNVLMRNWGAGYLIHLAAGAWNNTAAINRIDLSGATFVTGSMFTLYGIKCN